ncbi:DUF6766 family protein [Agriterribacter sp.]|uniref:DUF6766 family protein n=1 Tax=Agriterribacter sp. TaxID=2821509 RepID=UPI002B92435B|nr:DUF6766 family protein [Agriterribacter sp.]HRP56343.1 hypothetical protein [Agriterribacter sp.]
MAGKYTFVRRNGLSLVLLGLMLVFWTAQFLTGRGEKNKEREEEGKPALSVAQYSRSGHFIQATFENWESEFLQMALYVLLTVSLRQMGSSESKKMEGEEEVDREPRPHPDAPWPVKKGGIWLSVYKNSLSIAFGLLFLASFMLHFYGSLKGHNEEQSDKGLPPDSWNEYIASSRFWFESFQNWQSEFLAVASIVLLSIWLRQKGSPESKPVDAPYDETGG